MDNLVRVGDRVEVINKKRQFDLYSLQAMKMGAKHWHRGTKIDNGTIGYIVTIAKHFDAPNSYPSIALVRLEAGEVEVLIGIDGLKKIESFKVGDNVEFIRWQKEGKKETRKWQKKYGLQIGDLGIIDITSRNNIIAVQFPCNDMILYCYDYQIRKIPNNTKTYDEPTTKAITDSIKHHEDNLYRLKTLNGDFVNQRPYQEFIIGNHVISYQGGQCALCNKFVERTGKCEKCPLTITGQNCNDKGIWEKLKQAVNRGEAINAEANMIKVLKGLLGDGEKKDDTTMNCPNCNKKMNICNYETIDENPILRVGDKIPKELILTTQYTYKCYCGVTVIKPEIKRYYSEKD